MSAPENEIEPPSQYRKDGLGDEQSFDPHTRAMAQEAGLDRDLESQVPPQYGRFSAIVISTLAILAVLTLLWILL